MALRASAVESGPHVGTFTFGGRRAPRVAVVCPRCLMAFPAHVVVAARCTKRWRGHNFDAAAAEGNVAAALAAALGVGARTTGDLEALLRRVFVRAYGEGLDANPAATFDPGEGERFEFHVGLRHAEDAARVKELEEAVRRAVAGSRHFVLA